MIQDSGQIQAALGYEFSNQDILRRALTHSSAANENRLPAGQDNEQLEFLGDSIIGFFVSEFLFRNHESLSEGELSKVRAHLVSSANLCKLARQLELGDFLVLGRGEEKTGGRKKQALLADGFEALVAAIYIDGGLRPTLSFLTRIFKPDLDALKSGELRLKDYKSQLQELLQSLRFPPPEYHIIQESGPDHRKHFQIELRINGQRTAEGHGNTKKLAEQEAARRALEVLAMTRPTDGPVDAGTTEQSD